MIISLLLLGGWQVAVAQEAKGFVADKIIAKIDNYIILKSELEGAYQNY
ncbi:MAG TPA: peptidylprolyl isomerase, partial [Cytophagales bacterium]|nr:peptidylprolyl isomerase [Cytophagales bacterium]